MWTALLALGVCVSVDDESTPRSSVLYVRTADDWAPLRSGPVDRETVPLNSRSERIPCAAQTKDGIGFRVWAGGLPIEGFDELEVVAIQHDISERVLAIGVGRVIVGAPVLPARASWDDTPDLLPFLARNDGVSWSRGIGRVEKPVGLERSSAQFVAVFEEVVGWTSFTPDNYRRPSWTGRSSATGEPHAETPPFDRIDQAFFAEVREVVRSECVGLDVRAATSASSALQDWSPWHGDGPTWPRLGEIEGEREDVRAALERSDDRRASTAAGGLIEVWYGAPPPAPEGRTWTLLVSVKGSSAWPPWMDAPRASRARLRGQFVDASRELGIEMVHFEGPDLQLDIRPTMGPGAAWGDVDGDGWVDLFLPQGGGRAGSEPPTSRFFRNVDGKRFVDESVARGLAHTGAGMGALFYDADGDGDLDLFVANYGRNRFLLNDGTGRFADTSARVGLDSDLWHAAVSAADYDADGDLDLYVTSYLRYDTSAMPSDEELGRYQREDPVEMLPFAFPGERKLLLRCDLTPASDGAPTTIRYVDVAKDLGVDDPNGRGMQAIWWDFDRDGDQDLYLANDVSPNRFWRNEGGGKLKDVGFSTGLDDPRGCMGLSAGDIDGDLDEDLFITNWQLETNALYVNNLRHTSAKSRVSTFRDRAVESGVAAPSVGVTGWGAELADFDLDGDLDLFYANGYTSPDYESTGICVGQPCHYLENDGTGKFTPAFEKAGPDVALPLAARAAIACDYDRDGDLDVAVTANNGRFRLLRNDAPRGKNHWLGIRLQGAGGNTRAIGAQVVVEAGERKLLRSLRAGTSYLTGNAPELHFGLGEATQVTSCTVRWPNGRETTHAIEGVDRFVTIAEPR